MKITWFGHSAFRIDAGASAIMIDPFLSGNPVYEGTVEEASAGATHVALTHGHDDHLGDAKDICASTGATLIAVFEICMHLGVEKFEPTNTGGTITPGDFDITFVRADHSSSSNQVYLGNPCGLIVRPENGPVVYHMGDTDIFGDMALINEMYAPEIGIVPIGDRFTMGARSAALACRRFFDFKTILPCHYGTFPIIDATADKFIAEMGDQGSRVKALKVGDSIEA